MVLISYSNRELSVKIVYYGAGLSGKTTNLYYIYKKTQEDFRGELVSLDTDTERTLFFDLLPMEVGKIMDLTTKIQLYTVPGQVHYNSTRKLVLKGVDGIVFVVDSQAPLLEANIESLENLKQNLKDYNLSLTDIPVVFQYNKRDLKNILPVETLNKKLNPYGFKYFESIATTGKGVFETLREITRLTLDSVKNIIVETGRRGIIAEEVQNLKEASKKKKKKAKKEISQEQENNIKKEEEKKETVFVSREEIDEIEDIEDIEDIGAEKSDEIEIEKVDEIDEKKETEDKNPNEIEMKESKEEEVEDKKEESEDLKGEEEKEKATPKESKKIKVESEKEKEEKSDINIIKKNLSLSVNKKILDKSTHLWLQFNTPEGVIIKKWKISKEKIKDGANLHLNIELKIK